MITFLAIASVLLSLYAGWLLYHNWRLGRELKRINTLNRELDRRRALAAQRALKAPWKD